MVSVAYARVHRGRGSAEGVASLQSEERLGSSYRAEARGLRLVDGAGRGQRDCVVTVCPLHRQETVGDITAYPLGRSRKRVAITAAARADTNEPLACADLHMWNF